MKDKNQICIPFEHDGPVVYFLEAIGLDRVKIGWSAKAHARICELRTIRCGHSEPKVSGKYHASCWDEELAERRTATLHHRGPTANGVLKTQGSRAKKPANSTGGKRATDCDA